MELFVIIYVLSVVLMFSILFYSFFVRKDIDVTVADILKALFFTFTPGANTLMALLSFWVLIEDSNILNQVVIKGKQ